MKIKALLVLAGLFVVSGCGEPQGDLPAEFEDMPGFRVRQQALSAPCTVMVEGVNRPLDIETEYLPGVVACENGNAPFEALKAQAVQARGFVYYKLLVAGATVLSDSQGDQVYSCTGRLPNGPSEIHKRAVAETKGQYLEFNNYVIAPFYVAGNRPPNPDPEDPINSCNGAGGAGDAGTEGIVTYNYGKAGCDIEMASIGWTPADCMRNPHNRGAASQNGQSCLDNLGWKYQDMFDFYYGADIQLVAADGACGGPPPTELTDYDRFCGLKANGSYCFDAATRVECVEEYGGPSEICAGECVEGACVGGVEPGDETCADLSDGNHCLDNILLATCAGGQVQSTLTCGDGCFEGACMDAVNNGNNVGGPNNNNVGGPGVDPVPNTDDGEFPALVSTSPGVEGGCATAGSRSPTSALVFLILGLFGVIRRRR